jgi:hypothetical protein
MSHTCRHIMKAAQSKPRSLREPGRRPRSSSQSHAHCQIYDRADLRRRLRSSSRSCAYCQIYDSTDLS